MQTTTNTAGMNLGPGGISGGLASNGTMGMTGFTNKIDTQQFCPPSSVASREGLQK